jgi:uncharacterized metal-binding protein
MSNAERRCVVIVPCSGIGKAFGSVAREAGYAVCEDLRPDTAQLVALSKLVMGEAQARQRVQSSPAVTIDGCKLACAAKLVRHSGGTVAHEIAVLDIYRQHKDLKPEGIAELNEEGRKLARVIAEGIAIAVDELCASDAPKGGE